MTSTCTSSCRFGRRPVGLLSSLVVRDLRGYAELDIAFGPGPQLVWGPNAAGKTSLLEAIVLLAWGRSHRTSTDGELVRWGTDMARIEVLHNSYRYGEIRWQCSQHFAERQQAAGR